MLRRLVALLLVLLAVLPAADARVGSGGTFDPFSLGAPPPAIPYGQINYNTKAVSLRTQSLDPAVRNLVIVAAGQSNISNAAPSAYVPAHAAAIDNFNITDGGIYAAADPLLGCVTVTTNVGNPVLRLADALITANKFDRVVIAPIGIGSTSSADWATGIVSNRLPVLFARLAARGFVAGTNVTVVVLWGQGEADNSLSVTQPVYAANMATVIAASRAAGFAGKWFIAQQTWFLGAASAPVEAAQLALVDHGNGIWAGPDADALIANNCSAAACRQADDTHWTDAGSASYATAWQTALAASGAPF